MRKVNLSDLAEDERKSPKGKFHKFVKDISIALGREKDSLDLAKRHPFDLAQVRIPKGKSYCPYHGHSAETELYVVVSGRGKVRDHRGTTEVMAGDSFFFAPGQAHQLSAAENEARARGCRKIVLSTHSFQAPDFYRNRGYIVAGEFSEYPRGHRSIFLEKCLS